MSTPYQEPLISQSLVEPALIPLLNHELRTSLAAIKGFTSLLLRYQQQFSPREQRELLEEIALGCERLDSAIAHVVAISEIAAGIKVLSPNVVDLAHLVRTVLALSSDMTRDAATRWQYQVNSEPESAMPIIGDARELSRVLTLLLGLALQSSPDEGTMTIALQPWHNSTARIAVGPQVPHWEIQVRDVGGDAADDSLQHLFHSLAVDSLDLVHHSTDLMLGLLYCKLIVTLHGGQMWADRQSIHGNTLHLILPAIALATDAS